MTYNYFDKSKWKHGGDTSMAQDAYLLQTAGLILGFRGFMFLVAGCDIGVRISVRSVRLSVCKQFRSSLALKCISL